jgi:hypothetical protein
MRRKSTEIIMSVAAVGFVLLLLILFDGRVRQEFSLRWDSGPTAEVQEVTYTARKLAMVVVQAAKDQGLAHTPILIFVFAGSVLLLFMTRT